MALSSTKSSKPAVKTSAGKPRLAPPVPAVSLLGQYEDAAKELSIELMPWQTIAARYMTAVHAEKWLYRSVSIVVARQNGKTELLLPRILMGLRQGRRMLHTAQNRQLPRETFLRIAAVLNGHDDVTEVRYANGQEVIKFRNGGRYTLVAPRPGVRGNSVDDVFLDEVREQRSFELIAGLKPTMTASKNPQIIYLSNAGDEDSVVLNDLRRRADTDRSLAYLEWSAAPERELSDREGWTEANPALGITIQPETLEDFYESLPAAVFETEHLCRWVITMQPKLIDDAVWQGCRAELKSPLRPVMAISVDPDGRRASAAIAWQSPGSDKVFLRVLQDVQGDPISTEKLGPVWRQEALKMGVYVVAYDPWTDADLARYFRKTQIVNGRDYANASVNFAAIAKSGRLQWDQADQISGDLQYASRKSHSSGTWMAVKAKSDRPITAVLAAIRAVWLASGEQPSAPRVM